VPSRRLRFVVVCLAAASVAAGIGTTAFAQRYPPFPIGDGTQSGAGNTAPSTNSGSGSEFFNPGGASGEGRSGAGGSSNTDDDPACDVETCLRYAGQVGGSFVLGRVQEGGSLRVGSLQGCCQPFARIDVYIESERVFLGTVRATEDGSYFGAFKLPSSIKAGQHHVVADIEGCGELRGAVLVVAEGATVLGTSTSNTTRGSDAGGSGILPRTGSDFFRVILWALILIALGTLLILAARRFAPAHAHGGRVRVRGAVAALPPPEVPFVDTSRFVPYRSAPGQRIVGAGPDRTPRARPTPTTQRARTTSAWDRAPKNESPS
jgi:hypothetical protein